jgi:hypothetical protein
MQKGHTGTENDPWFCRGLIFLISEIKEGGVKELVTIILHSLNAGI